MGNLINGIHAMFKKLVLNLCLLFSLAGCSYFHVYSPTVDQGNNLSQDEINQLKPGMSRQEVLELLGDPVLNSEFSENELHYVYYIKPGHSAQREQQLTLYFNKENLVKISGTQTPETNF